jgi:anti-sigma factor RsiW
MTKHCDSIETLAMTFLDGELADEELRDFELHLLACAACRSRVEAEDAALTEMRRRLAPPPAPDLLRARIGHALDAEDRTLTRQARLAQVKSWLLPGAASLAAAAALIVFVTVRPPAADDVPVSRVAVSQHMRNAPLEVTGAATTPWIRRNYGAQIEPPRFADSLVRVAGARLTDVVGRKALQIFYDVTSGGGARYALQTLMFDATGVELPGEKLVVGGRELTVDEYGGFHVVSFRDTDGLAYVFTSADLGRNQLVDMVVNSNLVLRVQERWNRQ